MCGSLTHINPPRVLTSRQVHGGNKEHLYGFIRDLASLIYWQNLPLSACPSADFSAAVVRSAPRRTK